MPTSRHHAVVFTSLLSALCVVSGAAWAGDELMEDEVEEQAAEEADMERAQESFDQGARYYYDGDYSSAIVEFRRANQIHEHPIFYHNIALSNKELGRPDRALDAALSAEEQAAQLPPETAATNSGLIAGYTSLDTGEEVSQDLAALIDEDDDVDDVDEAPEVEEADRWGGLGWGGVATLVAGSGALVGAAVTDQQVAAGIDQLRDDRDSGDVGPDAFDDRRDELAGQQTMGQILLFSGAGLALAGTSLIAWELMTPGSVEEESGGGVALSPQINRPGIELLVRW